MATTVTASTLKVVITTQITLKGDERNTTNELNIASVNEYDSRIMTIPITEVTVIALGAQVAAGTFIKGNLQHFQVTNLDAVNYARINVNKVNTYGFNIKLEAGKSFILGNSKEYATAVGAPFVAFVDIDSISAIADQSPVDIEYVVAST